MKRAKAQQRAFWALVLATAFGLASAGEAAAVAVDVSGGRPAGVLQKGGASDQARELREEWGVEVVSLRRTGYGHMLDFRYKVLDAKKAEPLFRRATKPNLVHQASGKVLAVPVTAKVGPLRNSNAPLEGRTYWMFFGNAGDLVQAGDKATVVIGDFRAEDLIVE